MELFETVISKHGEQGLQAILENWERYRGISYAKPVTLEVRWDRFMRETNDNITCAAA